MTLSGKITLAFGIFIFIPLVIFIGFYFFRISDVIEESYINIKNDEITLRTFKIQEVLSTTRSEIQFLSELASVKDYINATGSASLKGQYREDMSQDFLALAEVRPLYYQIRYIDAVGDEIVRIDNLENGPIVISDEDLQNKADRYYFTETKKKIRGEIYISPLDLNIEHGALENRGTEEDPVYVPVIRFAIPLYDENNAFQGIIITNVYGDAFLSVLTTNLPERTSYYLVNNEGYFLSHPQPQHTFGFMKDTPEYTIVQEFPEIAQMIDSHNASQSYIDIPGNRFAYIQTINLLSGNDDSVQIDDLEHVWTLIKISDKSDFDAQVQDIATRLGFYGFIIFSVASILGYIFIRQNLKPLSELERATTLVSAGNLDAEISVKTGDEIESLADNFNKMIRQLKKSKENIDAKIRERTERLSKLNKVLIGRELKMAEMKKKISDLQKKHE